MRHGTKVYGGLRGTPAPPPVKGRDGGRADFLKPLPRLDYERITEDDLLSSQLLRLNTLYRIVDKDGVLHDFRMNREQWDFFRNMHNKNIILKARQRGFTTLIQLFLLDTALFRPNTSCGVIAHTKDDAEKFFDLKIKLAYDHIPADFKARHLPRQVRSNEGELKFANGSIISVGTSMRSSTLQYLHISEFGKLCVKFPEKADEVVSGALNTVSASNWVTIESTGEGTHGHFFDMVSEARKLAEHDQELSPMDYKFFFYPWWTAHDYKLSQQQAPTDADSKYFLELQDQSNIYLTGEQRNWYVAKMREQKERMWREYPSTPDEAFRGLIEGAPLSRMMAQLRRDGRIRPLPWQRGLPVNTFWDLGRNDKTAIWFHQRVGFEDWFIDYYETNFQPIEHYARVLIDRPYVYGEHYLPHDGEVVELSRTDGKSRLEILEDLVDGDWQIVDRIATEEEGVNITRNAMGSCYFDTEKTAKGVVCLENVRYRFDKNLQEFQPHLMRTQHKHGYDAFAQWGHGYRHRKGLTPQAASDNALSRAATLQATRRGASRYTADKTDWRT
jgi:hypothetical protein